MSQEITYSLDDVEQILTQTCHSLVDSATFASCASFADKLKPLFTSTLERHVYSVLERYVYGEFSDQIPLLNNLVNAFLSLIRPSNQLCVKGRPGGAAEDVVRYVIESLIQNGLVPCFINSVVINNRLNRIQSNLDHMHLKPNWMTNWGIWNFVREKDFWISSEYTSVKPSSSLQVTVDNKQESLPDQNVSRADLAAARKALKRPASHEYPPFPCSSETDELECLGGTYAEPNEDFRAQEEKLRSRVRYAAGHASRTNNFCTQTTCPALKAAISKYSKIRKYLEEPRTPSRTVCNGGCRVKMRKFRQFARKSKHSVKEECHKCPKQCRGLREDVQLKNDVVENDKGVETEHSVSQLNMFIKEESESSTEAGVNFDVQVVSKATVSTNTGESLCYVVNPTYSDWPELNQDLTPLPTDKSLKCVKLEAEPLETVCRDTCKEDKTSPADIRTTVFESQSWKPLDQGNLTDPPTSDRCKPELPVIAVPSVFDIAEKLKVSPYLDPEDPQLEMELQKLLVPIILERNDRDLDVCPESGVNSIGIQTQCDDSGMKHDKIRLEGPFSATTNFDWLASVNRSFGERKLRPIEEHSFNASGDFVKCLKETRRAVFRHDCGCSTESMTTVSKVFQYNGPRHFDPPTHRKRRRRPCHRSKKAFRPQKKRYRKRKARHKESHKKKDYKNMKKSVIADFLCLPFVHAIRELVYKILTEKASDTSEAQMNKCNCCSGQTPASNLRNFDSSYEDCECAPKFTRRKRFSFSIKKPTNVNCSDRCNQRMAGGGKNSPQILKTQQNGYCAKSPKFVHRRPCIENSDSLSVLHSSRSRSSKTADADVCSSCAGVRLTICPHSFDTPISQDDSSLDVRSWLPWRRNSSRSTRCSAGRCRNEETTGCFECDGMTGMRGKNRSAGNRLPLSHKNHGPCHFCSESSDKSGRRAATQRNAGSSSGCQSHSVTDRCARRTHHLSKFGFDGLQHVEPAARLDSRKKGKPSREERKKISLNQ